MRRSFLVMFAMAVLACGGGETAPQTETSPPVEPSIPDPPPAEPPPSAQPPSTQPPATVNRGHACTADADCGDLTAIAPAMWRCLGESVLLRSGMPDGPEPRLCLHVDAESSLYCNAVDDCPPGRAIPAFSENVTCTAHLCAYVGRLSSPEGQ